MCNVGRYYKNSGRDVIGQLVRDVIGRLSVEPRCNWLERLNSDWCVSIRLQVLGQYVYRRIRWALTETSVNVISNSPSQDYTHPDDRTLLYDMTPGFKPFTILKK